jgi:Tfp pilus assembly protein PilO
MRLSVRNMIAIGITVVILLGVFFTIAVYYPTNKRAKRMAKSRALLEAQVEAASPVRRLAQREATIIDALSMDVDFFKKRDLSPGKGIPKLLEQINRMGNEMKIRFVAVKPLAGEEAPEYQRYPFLIETRAAYAELVNFVYRIENGLRLTLNDLMIETDKKIPSMHRLQFALNIFELKNDLTANPGETGVKQALSPANINPVNVGRDPFLPKKQTEIVQAPQMPKKTNVSTKKRRPPKLVLMGIMDIAGNRRAIINDKILRPGDMIRGQRIDQIAEDHVIMGQGERTYALYLKGSSSLEGLEVIQ